MKSRFASVFVVLGLVACGGSADGPGKPPAEPEAGVTPTPTAMRPQVAPEELAGIRAREESRSARALAEVERRFASRTPGLTFRVRRVDTNSMGDTHVWIQQVFQGTPVVGRDLGVIVYVDDTLRVLGEPDTFERVPPSRLTATAGLKRAREHVARKGLTVDDVGEVVLEPVHERRLRPGASGENAADYETVVVGFERGTRVEVTSAFAPDEPRELFVRERDGAVLERGFPPSSGMVKAALYSRFAGNVALPTYQDARGIYLLQSERYDYVSAATQPNGTPAFDYQSKVNSWGDGQLYSFQGPGTVNGQTAAADAFISIYVTNRMLSDVYGRNGWDRQGGPIHAYVHAPETRAYPSGRGVIVLGYQPDSSGGFSGITLTDIETVAHEVGHMVFKEMTGVTTGPTGELGGLNEGTADIFGLVAGFYLPDALATVTPCTPLRCGGGGFKPIIVRRDWIWGNWADPRNGRSFIDPVYGEWTPALATASSHYASGPLARMFYFLSVGVLPYGKAPFAGLTNPQRVSVYLRKGLAGIGIDAANWIWYHTLSGIYFSRVNSYHTAREMMLEATMGIYQRKPHTPEYKAVEDAWAAVNVGPPADRAPPTVSITAEQKSQTEAIITVDVSDENGIADGTVFISSSVIDGPTILEPCTGHCVFTINPVQYGSHTSHSVEVTAKDTRENEVSRKIYFALDINPPSKTLTSNKPASWLAIAPQQDYKFSGTDNMGITQAKLLVDGVAVVDQSWSTAPVPSFTIPSVVIDISHKANGRYPLRVEVRDRFNMTYLEYSLVVDRAPPDLCTLTAAVDPANNGKVHLTLTARDDLSGLALAEIVRVGKGVVSTNTPPTPGVERTFTHVDTVPSTGQYTYYARCVDRYSNSGLSPSVSLNVKLACNTMAVAGGAQVDERIFDMGKPSGTVTLSFHTFSVHDHIKVYSGSLMVASSGCASTGYPSNLRTMTFFYQNPSSQLRVRVEPNCDPATALPTTEWQYSLSCP